MLLITVPTRYPFSVHGCSHITTNTMLDFRQHCKPGNDMANDTSKWPCHTSETNSSEISSVVLVNVSSEVIPDCYQTNVYLGLFREINLTLTCLLFRRVTLANFCLLWRNTALNNSIFMNFIVICKVNPDAQTCTRWIYKGTHTHTSPWEPT